MVKKKKSKAKSSGQVTAYKPSPSFFESILDSKFYVYYYMAFIFILTIILFNEFVFSGKMLHSSDGINASLYFRQYWADSIKEFGSVPLWSPLIFGGMPFVEAFHSDIFYPLSYVFKMIMPIPQAFGWSMIFHIFLSGIFMYLCGRTFGLSKLASSIAGIFYMFAPYLVSMVQPGHDGKMYVTALFPLTMMFLERGMNNGKFLDFAILGGIIGVVIMSPHPQMSYFMLWALGFYFGFRLIFKIINKKGLVQIAKPAGYFVIAIILGLCVSAIQFYPAFKYVKDFSPRSEDEVMTPQKEQERYAYATSWSLNEEELVAQFIPNFCGNNASKFTKTGSAPPTYWGQNYFKDNSEYIGILPIFFGIIGLIFVREKRLWFLLGLSGFAVIYGLGASTPFFKIFYHLIPNVKHLRAPSMIMFLFSFSFCLMAGYGINFIQKKLQNAKANVKSRMNLVLMISAAVYLVLALLMSSAGKGIMRFFKDTFNPTMSEQFLATNRGFPDPSDVIIGLWILAFTFVFIYLIVKAFSEKKLGLWILGLIAFFGLVDAWRMDLKFITTMESSEVFAKTRAVDIIKSDQQPYVDRALVTDRGILQSKNYFAYHGVPQMFGYHGNQMKIYDKYWGRQGKANDHSLMYRIYQNRQNQNDPNNGKINWLNIPFISLAGVKYIVTDNATKIDMYAESLNSRSTARDVQRDNLVVYELKEALGRTHIFHDYIIAPDIDQALIQMHVLQHDWRNTVFVASDPGFAGAITPDTIGEKAEIIEYTPNNITIDCKLNSDGLVYLTDCYYPAWKAFVDGEEVEIIQANAAFRAVPLAAGSHTLEFKFISDNYNTSKIVTYASSLFILGVLAFNVVPFGRKRKKSVE